MTKYVEIKNSCNHQSSSLLNLLSDENFGDETHSTVSFIKDSEEAASFCVLCRSLANSSNVNGEWDNNYTDCSEHVINSVYQGDMQRRLLINASDGADIPLLSNGDGYGTNSVNVEETDHCHTALPISQNVHAVQQLVAALLMCLVFMVAEVVGGYLAGSLAIMTDAAHLLSDFAGFLVSLFAIRLSKRPANTKLSFGYYRAEIIGALLSISIIWVLTGIISFMAVHRIIHKDFDIKADTMMIVAAIGIVVNIVMGLILHGVCHGISHGHSHTSDSMTERLADHSMDIHQHPKNQKHINVRAAVIHVIGDLIQSIGVFIAAVIIKIFPDADLVDPWCTLLFAVIALGTSIPVLRDSIHVLMEAFPRSHNYGTIVSSLLSVEGVKSIHNLHVWSLTVNNNQLSVHLAIDPSADPELVLKRALQLVRRKFDIINATIQVERYSAESMQQCGQCQPLSDK